uniref:Putative kinesin-like protein n=1 Tax=Tabanus bromius TaxID=304241 RepID=A0A0K8TKQ0_TABBR
MSSLKVAVRVRPFNQREMDMDAQLIVHMEGKKTSLMKSRLTSARDNLRDNHHDFTFDYSYWSHDDADMNFVTQEQVYKDLGLDVIDCAFQGYNACVFAYGQTGSGKTYTMMGSSQNPGLIPRICQELFNRIKLGQETGTGYRTQASYLEIYNERVKDLLGAQSTGHGLRVREHRTLGPYVENLSQHIVNDYEEIQECLVRGNIQRTTASTNMNDTSSRSHAIFTITFVQAGFLNDMPSETVSKIHLVDLAGSERANATGATGQRLKEGAHINKSLVTLGSVISALADQTNRTEQNKRILYIPYRDSVLTWLLKDSLGGNSKTIMVAAISPADCNYSETLSTLRYANRAKNIINKPTVNEDPNVKLIRELRDEICKLKSMLTNEVPSSSSKVLEDLLKKEAQEKVLTEEWTEKWREAQMILQEQKSLGLRKAGVGVVLDSEMPHLIGIHDDISTGVTLYSLKEGETAIGTEDAEKPQDIVLSGQGILSSHCSIVLLDSIATIYPRPQAQCWLNAKLIDEPTRISQGDIILLGRTNIFRFNNPTEAAKLRKDASRSRLDLSRLSLITASRENLTSSYYSEDESIISSPNKRDKQYHATVHVSREDPEMQDENRKILETIENALKQLNIERVQMHEQYKTKVKKLSDELKRLEAEERDAMEILKCREEELLARKDMLLWEKNNERIQIDIICRQISTLKTQLDSKKRDFFEYVAKELQELQDWGKLDELNIQISEGTPLSDEILLQVSDSLDPVSMQIIKDTVRRNRDDIRKLEEQISSKQKLLDISNEKIIKLDEDMVQLDNSIVNIINSSADIKFKKLSLKLNLKTTADTNVQTDGSGQEQEETANTCDTFHTASSECSFPIPTESPNEIRISPNHSNVNGVPLSRENIASIDPLMCDSGVCLDLLRTTENSDNIITSTPNGINRGVLQKPNDDDSTSCSSCEQSRNSLPRSFCIMHKLRRKIATQKALIMKNLELEVDKAQLDDQIAHLQDLKKKYIKMEKELQANNQNMECFGECDANSREDVESLSFSDDAKANSFTKNNYLSSPSDINCSPAMSRSCPSMDNHSETEHLILIPGFVIRGAGKQTHYEYEVRVNLPDEKLVILRRYSRFRELHLSMKNIYGSKVSLLPFPRREIFSINSESVAKHRRRLLELYLRRLLAVCSKIPQCSIYDGPGGPGITKASLMEFSNFFRKGLFESGKHGTG